MYAQLGSIVFEGRKSFNAFSSTKEVNLVELALIENKPRLQRVGSNLDTVSIGMFFDSSFCIPENEISRLNECLETSEIMSLINGYGTYVGDFIIKSINVTHSDDAPDGFIMQADVSVELLEYYDADRVTTIVNSAIQNGFATDRNKAPEYNPTVEPISDETAQALLEANVMANKIAAEQAKLKQNNQLKRRVEGISRDAIAIAENINQVLVYINADTASQVYQRTRSLADNCVAMIAEIADCTSRCTELIADIDNENTASIPAKIISLTNAIVAVKKRADAIQSTSASYIAYIKTT